MTADTQIVKRLDSDAAPNDWTLSLQIFLYLQVLDALTTWAGFHVGLAEASPFIRMLMRTGPLTGLLASKIVAIVLGGYCVWSRRFRVISILNYWYAGLAVWNLALIVSLLRLS